MRTVIAASLILASFSAFAHENYIYVTAPISREVAVASHRDAPRALPHVVPQPVATEVQQKAETAPSH